MFLKIIVGNDSIDNLQYYYLSELGEYQFYHSSGVCGYQFSNSSRVNVYKINFWIHHSSGVLSLLIYSLFISDKEAQLTDPLELPRGPITRARAKKFKEALHDISLTKLIA